MPAFLAHPQGHVDLKTALAVVGGPALYLLGNAMFKRSSWPRVPLSHLAGLALLLTTGALLPAVAPWLLSALVSFVLAMVAVWEWHSLRSARAAARAAAASR